MPHWVSWCSWVGLYCCRSPAGWRQSSTGQQHGQGQLRLAHILGRSRGFARHVLCEDTKSNTKSSSVKCHASKCDSQKEVTLPSGSGCYLVSCSIIKCQKKKQARDQFFKWPRCALASDQLLRIQGHSQIVSTNALVHVHNYLDVTVL